MCIMFFKKKRSHWKKYALISIALASLTGSIYLSGVHAATKNNEKSLSDFETQLKDALKKNHNNKHKHNMGAKSRGIIIKNKKMGRNLVTEIL